MIKHLFVTLFIGLLFACSNHADNTSEQSNGMPINRICSAPPAPQNIWKLEPMLKDKGLIKEDMTRKQKEEIIRNYINKKNSAYTKCVKGK